MLDRAYAIGAAMAREDLQKHAGIDLLPSLLAGGLAGGITTMTGGVPGSLLATPATKGQGAAQGASAVAGARLLGGLGQSTVSKTLLGLLGGVGGWQGANAFMNRERR